MKLIKAGESHGVAMVGILSGVPSGIAIDENFINELLAERCLAAGRSARQKLESDRLNFISGVRDGITLGNNIAIAVANAVHGDFKEIMHPFNANTENLTVTSIRPGHADLPGVKRHGFDDIRNVLEGASARSTCIDVAGGAIALQMLEQLGISITSFARGLGEVCDETDYKFSQVKGVSAPYFSENEQFKSESQKRIDKAVSNGDSLGGRVEIRVKGIKAGFGSYVAEKRVDGVIAQHIMNIQAVKGVYFGVNPFNDVPCGSEYVGRAVIGEGGIELKDSKSGGIDGGMTNGDEIVITVGIKPIPTTKSGVESVDIVTGQKATSAYQRSDVTAVFALCPILKCVVALALSETICERLGFDCMQKIKERYESLC